MPAGSARASDGQAFLPRKAREARGATNSPAPSSMSGDLAPPRTSGRELVHRVVLARGFQRGVACEIFLVVIANVAAAHILVLHAGNALANFGALDILDIAKHRLVRSEERRVGKECRARGAAAEYGEGRGSARRG